ncbi:hypothetical protein HY251_14940 [bacterium]|nr:hypothetical protein [bacterium]
MGRRACARKRGLGGSSFAWWIALAGLGAVAGCAPSSGGTGAAPPQVAPSNVVLTRVGGDSQSGIRAAFLPDPLVVAVQDGKSNPIARVPVSFEVTSGDACLTLSRTYSDSKGLAVANVTCGQTIGQRTIAARAGNASVSFTVTTTEYQGSRLVLEGFPGTIVAGTTASFTLTARDADGHQAVAYHGTVSFSSGDSMASLPGSFTFQDSDKGTHTFSATLRSVGTWSIRAVDAADSTIAGELGPITVVPMPVASLTVSGLPDPLVAGACSDVVVRAFYADGTIDPYYTGTITFSTTDSDAGARVPWPYTFSPADAGAHRFSQAVVFPTAGKQTITAKDSMSSLAASQTVSVAPSIRVTSFTSTKAAIQGTAALAWTVSGAPTKLTLDPGSLDETGKTTDTVTPFPAPPKVVDPRACYEITATNAAYPGRSAELAQAASGGGSGDDAAAAVAAFPDGSTVVVGSFSGSAVFGTSALSSSGGTDAFVARYDSDGTLAWAQRIGGSGDDAALGVAAFADGTAVVTGYFSGSASFDSQTTLASGGGNDAFVASFRKDGSLAWARSAGGTGDDSARAVSGFLDGSSTVVGSFAGTASFGGLSLASAGASDVFVARYGPSGSLLWARSAGGAGDDAALGVAVRPDGSSIVTGSFQGAATFGSFSLASPAATGAFFASYRSDGTVQWAKAISGTGDVAGAGAAAFADGSFVLTGRFAGVAGFDASTTLASAGASDAYVARYSQNGTLVWALAAGGTGDDSGSAVSSFPDGSCAVSGSFHGNATFGGTSLGSQGGSDAFLACYDAAGAVVWAKGLGGGSDDAALGVAGFSDGSCAVAGSFQGTAALAPGVALDSAGGVDAVLARFRPMNYLMLEVRPHGFDTATASGGATKHFCYTAGVAALPDGGTLATGVYISATGPLVLGASTLPATSVQTPFLIRFDPDGTIAWAASAPTTDLCYVYGVAVYADGSSVIVGDLGYSPVTFAPTIVLDTGGMFLARYAPDGTCTSAVAYPGVDQYPKGVCTFPDGSCAVASSTMGADFGGGFTVTPTGIVEAYVVHLKTDGTPDWLQASSGIDYGFGIGSVTHGLSIAAFSDGSCVATGDYSISAKFGSTTLTDPRSISNPNLWVVRFKADGTVDWAKDTVEPSTSLGLSSCSGRSVSAAPDGSVIACGYMKNDLTFGKGDTNETTLSTPTSFAPFVAKYNSDGTLAWAKMPTTTTLGRGASASVFPDGSVVVGGIFTGTIDFGSGTSLTSTSTTRSDGFIARFGSDGSVKWAKSAASSTGVLVSGVAAFLDGSSTIVGRFNTSVALGTGEPAAKTLVGSTSTDLFFGKFFDP